MYVKIMSGEDMPDGDSRKTYSLFQQVVAVDFHRADTPPGGGAPIPPVLSLTFENGEREAHSIFGNVYMLNDQGKTVDSFGVAPYHGNETWQDVGGRVPRVRAPRVPPRRMSKPAFDDMTKSGNFVRLDDVPAADLEPLGANQYLAPNQYRDAAGKVRTDRSDPEGGIPGRATSRTSSEEENNCDQDEGA